MSYTRVIPRDLFNESKLLKCIGRMVLLIHDDMGLNGMTCEHDDDPFDIDQLEDDGALWIRNISFLIKEQPLFLKAAYNRKDNYPLYCQHDHCDYLVFDETGEYTQEFIDFCNSI